jgi:transcriptional regulator with XRE-family HTH domain
MTDDKERAIARRLGRRVRTGRAFKNVATGALAARAGLTRRRLDRIETGTGRRATADEFLAIAHALDLPLWFFFEGVLVREPSACPACGRKPRPDRRGTGSSGNKSRHDTP